MFIELLPKKEFLDKGIQEPAKFAHIYSITSGIYLEILELKKGRLWEDPKVYGIYNHRRIYHDYPFINTCKLVLYNGDFNVHRVITYP